MEKITEITLAWELFRQGAPETHIATHLNRSREAITLWLQGKRFVPKIYEVLAEKYTLRSK